MISRLFACLLIGLSSLAAHAVPLPEGRSELDLLVNQVPLQVYAYKPAGYRNGPLLVSFHGLSRQIDTYMKAAQPLADRHGLLLVMPLFDRERFPYWRYQALGITRVSRNVLEGQITVEPEAQWTSMLVEGVIRHLREREGQPLEYLLLGHSAGGQIVNRMAAFAPGKAKRYVVTNPSSWVLPDTRERFPYGFGDLPAAMRNESQLKRYLAQPLTVFLGTGDILDKDLDMRPAGMAQGRTRHARGLNAFHAAERVARERGWTFNWTLVEVPGVGHNSTGMYGSTQASQALGLAH
ncbi:MAG: hypothetical protein AB7E73_17220 [Burkholderiales bacterium]